jgi:dihydroneopterin aldolase
MSINAHLKINRLKLQVNLGWTDEERAAKQTVYVSYEIKFKEIPDAIITDNLKDTVCYGEISDKISNFVEKNEFKLIEYLSQNIYKIIKESTSKPILVVVEVAKPNAPVKNLEGEVSFKFGDIVC